MTMFRYFKIFHKNPNNLLLHAGFCNSVCEDLRESLERSRIIPDVIFCGPNSVVGISYPNGAKVKLGNRLTPIQVKDIPCIVHWEADYKSWYTLCMTDPDVPSRESPKLRGWLHWLVGNIPGDSVLKGQTLAEYIGALPQKGTGYHRYVFLIYKQPTRLHFYEPRLTDRSACKRGKFSISTFAEKYKLGRPVGLNFFISQYDRYVKVINMQLGLCTVDPISGLGQQCQ